MSESQPRTSLRWTSATEVTNDAGLTTMETFMYSLESGG